VNGVMFAYNGAWLTGRILNFDSKEGSIVDEVMIYTIALFVLSCSASFSD